MPMNLADYPHAWRKVSRTIRRVAGNHCEQCQISNGAPLPSGRPGRVVLTVAHIGAPRATGHGWSAGNKHDKHDVRRENLRALCQRCHLALDLEDHIAHAQATRARQRREKAQCAGQLDLFREGVQHA